MPVFVEANKELPWEEPDWLMSAQFYLFDQLHSSRKYRKYRSRSSYLEMTCTLKDKDVEWALEKGDTNIWGKKSRVISS